MSNFIIYLSEEEVSSAIQHERITNTVENLASTITLFPNPATDIITVQSIHGMYSYQITDALGTTLIDDTSSKTIDISSLTKGIYIISIQQDNQVINKRLIIE
ncbi:MAG: T9SS type A sorting domain-containing protein [Cytophagales bacterium]|nr:T9SS type A sorting domain-containing protein [Cytophagales bacterium]